MKKKCVTIMLTVAMLSTVFFVGGKQAEAAEAQDRVIYEATSNISTYWNADEKKAPVKEGYVFGGWFQKVEQKVNGAEESVDGTTTSYYLPLTSRDLNTDADPECDYSGMAYAKFVPAQVLSVKAQNSANMDEEAEISAISSGTPGYIRVISSLDSTNYQKVGFEIELANSIPVKTTEGEALETTQVYTGIQAGSQIVTANNIFGGESKYLSVWQLSAIDTPSNADKIIYVRPYWVTMDGTKVNGLAKYVHIEDCYKNYISVPINLLDAKDVAAGLVKMTYQAQGLQFKEVEAGRILPEMTGTSSEGSVMIIGNAKKAGTYHTGETLFANVRFVAPDTNVEFCTELLQFCDWEEQILSELKHVWNVKYDAPSQSERSYE